MSQKDSKFQSKPRSGGKKFADNGKSGYKKGESSEKRSFKDRPSRSKSGDFDKNERGGAGKSFRKGSDDSKKRYDSKPRGERNFEDRPKEERHKRDASDRPRSDFGDRSRSQRPNRDFKDRPKRDSADRPRRERSDRPERSYDRDSRPQRRDDGERKRYDSKPRGERSFEDRPRRDYSDRPERSYDRDSRPQRRDDGERKRYDSKPRGERSFDDRPRRDRDDRQRTSNRPATAGKKYPKKDIEQTSAPKREFDNTEAKKVLKSDRTSYGAPSALYLYGVHAVTNALLNPEREHKRLFCTEASREKIEEVIQQAMANDIQTPKITIVEKEDIERLLPRGAVHQDLLLDSKPLEEVFLVDIINSLQEDAKIIILDQVTDPHNIGAVMRSVAAFGASAIIMQKLHAPEITGVLAKSASGAVEHVPLIREVNLSRAIEKLKEAGFFCIGLDEEGKSTLAQAKLSGKVALVLGSEGSGIRRLVAKNCDELVKLPTLPPIGSLNVSNAAAIALYELAR